MKKKVKFGSSLLKMKTMKTLGTFPDDLVEEILSRLQVRHLLRLRCVSKSWRALIDSSSFIEKNHQTQYAICKEEGDVPLFLDTQEEFLSKKPGQFYLFSKKRGDIIMSLTSSVVRDSAPHFSSDGLDQLNTLNCMGVMKGIVCLRWWRRDKHNKYLGSYQFGLWNPATREFKEIPHPRPPCEEQGKGHNVVVHESHNPGVLFGLGFDANSNNFKVVRSIFMCHEKVNCGIKRLTREVTCLYEIYSCNNNSWKRLQEPLPNLSVDCCSTDGYFHSVQYWTAREYGGEPYRRFLIISFDFSTEEFKCFDPPPGLIDDKSNWSWMVGEYKEKLAVTFNRVRKQELGFSYYFEIWVTCTYNNGSGGVQTRIPIPLPWQHLFTIGPIPNINIIGYKFRMDDDLLFTSHILRDRDRDIPEKIEAILYKSSTGTYKKLGFPIDRCFNYVESLFPIS